MIRTSWGTRDPKFLEDEIRRAAGQAAVAAVWGEERFVQPLPPIDVSPAALPPPALPPPPLPTPPPPPYAEPTPAARDADWDTGSHHLADGFKAAPAISAAAEDEEPPTARLLTGTPDAGAPRRHTHRGKRGQYAKKTS